MAAAVNRGAGHGPRFGPWASQLELATSLDPKDYCYPTPTPQQAELLAQQARMLTVPAGMLANAQPGRLEGSQPGGSHAATGFEAQLAAQGASGGGRADLASVSEDLALHLQLDMDDDCLRLLLGEEGDESKPEPSSGASVSTCTGAGAGKEPAESAPAVAAVAAAAPVEEEEELLLEAAPSMRHDDPSVELGATAGRARSCALSASKCGSDSDGTTVSRVAEDGSEQQGGASPLKRAKCDLSAGLASAGAEQPAPTAAAAPKPAPYAGLMLSMDYQSAVESINLHLTCSREEGEASLAEEDLMSLSPVAGARTPEGPDLLSPGVELLPSSASKWGLASAEEGGLSAKRKRR